MPEIDHQQLFDFSGKKSLPILLVSVYDIFWYLANTNADVVNTKITFKL